MEQVIAHLPVGAELLERLEDRRKAWGHEDYATTLRLLLDVVAFAESKEAAALASLAGDALEGGQPMPGNPAE